MTRFHTALLLILLAVAPAFASSSPPASSSGTGAGRIFLTVDEALTLAFPECDIERTTVYLTTAQRKRVEELAGTPLSSGIVHPYVATRKGQLVGTAFVDVHKVRTLRESLFVVVSPQGRVQRLEVLAFAEVPDRWALWHRRCPENPSFGGRLDTPLGQLRTHHWFDPCELLRPDARSELRPEFRKRAWGGGWEQGGSSDGSV